jgi:uncharacterized protein (DUF2147 family)
MGKLLISMLLLGSLAPFSVVAQEQTPIGLWKNIDDVTGKPRALIRIVDQAGELQGRIEKIFFEPGEDQNPKCIKCEGELKDKPTLGMMILSGFSLIAGEYTGGKILDPKNGKLYKSRMSLAEDGKKLTVRGYIGTPLIGRSQTWLREQ